MGIDTFPDKVEERVERSHGQFVPTWHCADVAAKLLLPPLQ